MGGVELEVLTDSGALARGPSHDEGASVGGLQVQPGR